MSDTIKVALVGNPNSGKSSLFNHLTGLNQKVGNFPGVTVDKKSGTCKIDDETRVEVIDLPGTYSLYPRSMDERVVFDILLDKNASDHPDLVIVIVDASNLKRNLLLFSQVQDLDIPVILALNMLDVSINLGQQVKPLTLAKELNSPVVSINARTGDGIKLIKNAIKDQNHCGKYNFVDIKSLAPEVVEETKKIFQTDNDYVAYLVAQQVRFTSLLSEQQKQEIFKTGKENKFNNELLQSQEIVARYKAIDGLVEKAVAFNVSKNKNLTEKLDKIFTHKIFGYVAFFVILFLIFQSIFSWAEVPMDIIDSTFAQVSSWLKSNLPSGVLVDLLTEGIIPGIGGVVIFIPQIAILFAFISLLEESGYMSRVVFLMDKIMRKFGLNGKSVVPLVSGVACAIPAIMATRTIGNWKERLITIFVTPLMSCSARLPVYTILIALVVPDKSVLGFLNMQGLALMGMYLLGFLAAITSASILKLIVHTGERSYFIMELPLYKFPRWKHVGLTIYEKSKTFVVEAGKVILAISIVLWVLASFPKSSINEAAQDLTTQLQNDGLNQKEINKKVEAVKLENSYAGIFGKTIEPVIKPLGYDWKIGIALITSFAAREVFVGTMATIYSIGTDAEDDTTIKNRMKAEINPETGGPRYTPAVAFSLLVFYAFAMQCMSTLAIVYRETKNWKYPLLQLLYLTGLAYTSSLLVYQLLS